MSILVHSLILSSHVLFCTLPLLSAFTVPCRIAFAKTEDLETWPNHVSFYFLTRVRNLSYSPIIAWIFLRNFSLYGISLYECSIAFSSILSQRPAFFPVTLLSRSTIHRYRENMDMTRERISFTFDPRDILLSLQIGVSFVMACVACMACALLDRISGFELSSETTAPWYMYLKLVTVPTFCQLTLTSLWMSLALYVVSLIVPALISILYFVQILSRLSTRASNSCSYSAKSIYVISKKGSVTCLSSMLIFLSCSSRAAAMTRSEKITGDNHVTCVQLSKPDVATLSYRRTHYWWQKER